jgi:ankyrin repeat protein
MILETEDPLAVAVVTAIHNGDLATLGTLLAEHPGLATARLGDPERGMSRTLLHVATDWPGHYPNGPAIVAALAAAGADVNARFTGPHTETPLHWAASSDDVAVLDALLDAGADINAPGAVIAGGTPLTDARAFRQWNTARRLVERGATVDLDDAATLGLMGHLEAFYAADPPPTREDTTRAFWNACHGGRQAAAEYLLARGADINWIPSWEHLTPLDAAYRAEAHALAGWLEAHGARSTTTPPNTTC